MAISIVIDVLNIGIFLLLLYLSFRWEKCLPDWYTKILRYGSIGFLIMLLSLDVFYYGGIIK